MGDIFKFVGFFVGWLIAIGVLVGGPGEVVGVLAMAKYYLYDGQNWSAHFGKVSDGAKKYLWNAFIMCIVNALWDGLKSAWGSVSGCLPSSPIVSCFSCSRNTNDDDDGDGGDTEDDDDGDGGRNTNDAKQSTNLRPSSADRRTSSSGNARLTSSAYNPSLRKVWRVGAQYFVINRPRDLYDSRVISRYMEIGEGRITYFDRRNNPHLQWEILDSLTCVNSSYIDAIEKYNDTSKMTSEISGDNINIKNIIDKLFSISEAYENIEYIFNQKNLLCTKYLQLKDNPLFYEYITFYARTMDQTRLAITCVSDSKIYKLQYSTTQPNTLSDLLSLKYNPDEISSINLKISNNFNQDYIIKKVYNEPDETVKFQGMLDILVKDDSLTDKTVPTKELVEQFMVFNQQISPQVSQIFLNHLNNMFVLLDIVSIYEGPEPGPEPEPGPGPEPEPGPEPDLTISQPLPNLLQQQQAALGALQGGSGGPTVGGWVKFVSVFLTELSGQKDISPAIEDTSMNLLWAKEMMTGKYAQPKVIKTPLAGLILKAKTDFISATLEKIIKDGFEKIIKDRKYFDQSLHKIFSEMETVCI